MPDADKVNVGLTTAARGVYDRLETMDFFAEGRDIARFGFAWAVRKGMTPQEASATDTMWHIATFDPSGQIADLIRMLFPSEQFPYRACESLFNQGLESIGSYIDEHGTLTLDELLSD